MTMLAHPPKSPDMNPIESIWGTMKHRVENEMPTSKNDLRRIVNEVWRGLSKETCQKTIMHLREVAKNVLENNGHYETKYLSRKGGVSVAQDEANLKTSENK